MSEESLLYQAPDESTPLNITQHIRAIYAGSELIEAATCKPRLQVRDEAGRQVSRGLKHYNLYGVSQRCSTLFNRHVIGSRRRWPSSQSPRVMGSQTGSSARR